MHCVKYKIQTFSTNPLVRKFSVNEQFPQIIERIVRKFVETVLLTKISSPEN